MSDDSATGAKFFAAMVIFALLSILGFFLFVNIVGGLVAQFIFTGISIYNQLTILLL